MRAVLCLCVAVIGLGGCASGLPRPFTSTDAPVEETRQISDPATLASAVVVGHDLFGGVLAERLSPLPTGDARAAGMPTDDRRAARRQAFVRLDEQRREVARQDARRQALLEVWQQQRIGEVAVDRESVRSAQRMLIALGHLSGPADGIAGPQTRAAVERFRREQGLPGGSEITPSLLESLRLAF